MTTQNDGGFDDDTSDPAKVPLRLCTIEETTQITRLSKSKLAQDRSEGIGIPYVRIGKRAVRYRFEDILAFVVERTIG